MINRKYNKNFYEKYAILSLSTCYDKQLLELKNLENKRESPDYQSAKLDIGIEVTEAITTKQGDHRFIINQYFGQGLRGEEVKEAAEKRFPQIIGRISVYSSVAIYSEHDGLSDFSVHIKLIKQSIVQKTKKLNSGYTLFARNWLYIFAHVCLELFDIDRILEEIHHDQPRDFDKVFINCIDRLYVISNYSKIETIEVENETLRQIKKAAFE